jgi:NAD(P)-dependent dehydrogenase (short-subunit alcohol dehydrogenase family)
MDDTDSPIAEPRQLRTERACLVVGAAGAIGAAVASRFLEASWTVDGWDRDPIVDPRFRSARVDLLDWPAVVAAAASLPQLQAVVNCTGIASRTPAEELEPDELSRVLAVNLVGAFALSRAVLPALRAGHGTLVHIASVGGHLGFRNRLAYDTSKAGLLAMVRHLAIDWGPSGVRVVSVSPGFVRGGMAERGIAEGRTQLSHITGHAPSGRLVELSEVANAVLAVVGPDLAGMNGSDLLVDGGFAALSGF